MIGSTQRTLIELDNQNGHTENFASVRLETPLPASNMRGSMIDVRITASDGNTLTGIPL